jgi:hypothetical protein
MTLFVRRLHPNDFYLFLSVFFNENCCVQPRRVRVCLAEPLSGRDQHLPLHPHDSGRQQEQLDPPPPTLHETFLHTMSNFRKMWVVVAKF